VREPRPAAEKHRHRVSRGSMGSDHGFGLPGVRYDTAALIAVGDRGKWKKGVTMRRASLTKAPTAKKTLWKKPHRGGYGHVDTA
jgi:hypothetical protein